MELRSLFVVVALPLCPILAGCASFDETTFQHRLSTAPLSTVNGTPVYQEDLDFPATGHSPSGSFHWIARVVDPGSGNPTHDWELRTLAPPGDMVSSSLRYQHHDDRHSVYPISALSTETAKAILFRYTLISQGFGVGRDAYGGGRSEGIKVAVARGSSGAVQYIDVVDRPDREFVLTSLHAVDANSVYVKTPLAATSPAQFAVLRLGTDAGLADEVVLSFADPFGRSVQGLGESGDDRMAWLVSDGKQSFYPKLSAGRSDLEIVCSPLQGGGATAICKVTDLVKGTPREVWPRSLAVDKTHLFVTTPQALISVPLANTADAKVIASWEPGTWQWGGSDAQNVYLVSLDGPGVRCISVPRQGGEKIVASWQCDGPVLRAYTCGDALVAITSAGRMRVTSLGQLIANAVAKAKKDAECAEAFRTVLAGKRIMFPAVAIDFRGAGPAAVLLATRGGNLVFPGSSDDGRFILNVTDKSAAGNRFSFFAQLIRVQDHRSDEWHLSVDVLVDSEKGTFDGSCEVTTFTSAGPTRVQRTASGELIPLIR